MAIAHSSRLLAGCMILAAAALAGCSSNNGSDATAAISGSGAAPAGAIASTQQAAPLVPALPPIDNATCDELKLELTALGAEKIPQKLAQFGQSKYTPTPDETTKFTRYVELSQASKARCKTAAEPAATTKKKKQQTSALSEGTAAPATEKKAKATMKKATEKAKTVAVAAPATTKKKVSAETAATVVTDESADSTTPLIGTKPTVVNVDAAAEGVTTTIIPD